MNCLSERGEVLILTMVYFTYLFLIFIFMKALTTLATWLVIIGAINWGLVGFFSYDLVSAIFGAGSTIARIIFAVVGLSGIVVLIDVIQRK